MRGVVSAQWRTVDESMTREESVQSRSSPLDEGLSVTWTFQESTTPELSPENKWRPSPSKHNEFTWVECSSISCKS